MKGYKIGLIVFLLLAVIISLFPPFEFDNERLRKLQEKERDSYFSISEEAPFESYDFIFNHDKKYIKLYSHNNYSFSNAKTVNYYLLDRKILFGELLIEYFLAFILGAVIQLGINYKTSKSNKKGQK